MRQVKDMDASRSVGRVRSSMGRNVGDNDGGTLTAERLRLAGRSGGFVTDCATG